MITKRSYTRVLLIAVGVFGLLSAALMAYNHFYLAPKKKCEAAGAWWSPKDRVCAAPIYLPTITGRKEGSNEATIDWHEGDAPPPATGTGR